MINNIPLKGKTCLVTGGGGFIGSHLVERLLELGCEVTVLDDLSHGSINNLSQVKDNPKLKFVKGSIENSSLVDLLVAKNKYIFHLAAANLIQSIKNPAKDLRINTLGTLNIVLAMTKTKVKPVLIYSSTGSVYGEPVYTPQDEKHPLEPVSPYGVSKLAAEKYVSLFSKQYNLPVVTLRYYNVYGPRQNFKKKAGVVGIFINSALKQKPLIIEGTGEQKRAFTFVNDIVYANILASVNPKAIGGIYNIGSNQITTINALADIVEKELNLDKRRIRLPRRIGEIDEFIPNLEKAKKYLKYQPQTSLKNGIKKTINWFLSNQKST